MVLAGCAAEVPAEVGPDALPLWWYPSDRADTWAGARAGLDWALSQLGALPPADGSAVAEATTDVGGTVRFTLRTDRLGLTSAGRAVVDDAWAELAATPEAPADVGRFLMRTLHEPWRYYAATGACPTRAEWEAGRVAATVDYAVTTSLLTTEERLIRLPAAPLGLADLAHAAESGPGSLTDGSFLPVEAEVLDVMPNGQFRYAVYAADGALLPAATHSPAGTPGKCAWCHEDHFQLGTGANQGAEGYLDYDGWVVARDAAQALLEAQRAALDTSVDYAPSTHEAGERLVEAFLYPDAARVAAEWGVSEAAVRRTLGEPTRGQDEFGWTERYARDEVDAAAPIAVVPTRTDTRELEPEHLADLAAAPAPGCD